MLQGAFQKVAKTFLPKQGGLQIAPPTPCNLRVTPTQLDPQIEQDKTQGNQKEAIGRILRGRPTQQLVGQAVTRLNPKTLPILTPTRFWRPVQMDANEKQPGRFPLVPPGAARRGIHAAHCQVSGVSLRGAGLERVARTVTGPPAAQRARAALLAANRAGNQSGLLPLLQVAAHLAAGKAFVEIQTTDAHPALPQVAPQSGEGFHRLGLREDKTQSQSYPPTFVNQISRDDTVKSGGAV